MEMFVLEARSDSNKVIGRAEFDNKKKTTKWLTWFQNWKLVQSIKVFKDDIEYMSWER